MSETALNDIATTQRAVGDLEEIPLFFGQGIFGVVHRPQPPGLNGWVLCSPFGSERTNSQRLYFEWARYLAAAGHWTLRFDYRGTGDSAGLFEDHTVHDYVDDISRATSELERLSGTQCRGVLGLRLGADLAAIFAANFRRPLDLVMWEPVVGGQKYRNSLLRTAMANELVNSSGPHKTRAELQQELAVGGSVSVDGFPITAQMFDSLATIDLPALGRPTSRPILIVQINSGRSRPPKPAVTKLFEAYSEAGETRIDSAEEPRVWMKTKSYKWHLDDLFGKTLGWMSEGRLQRPPAGAAAVAEPARHQNGHHIERPVGFEVEGERIWGILHEPVKPREHAPNVVMVSAGEACRTAFFYPRLARDLADQGWRVLRFDPRGIGDSHGEFDCDWLADVFFKIENGALVADVVAALDFMERECGTRESVLVGLCGGAITSAFTAQADDRVLGMAPLDFSLRLTQPAGDHRQSKLTNQVPWHEALSQREGTLFLLTARRFFHLAKDRCRSGGLAIAKAVSFHSPRVPGEDGWFRERIGEGANIRLLAALRKLVDRKIPIRCVFADTEDAKLLETVLPGLRAGKSQADSLIDLRVIQGADHNFILPGCAERLTTAILKWLVDPSVPWAQGFTQEPG